MKVSKVISLSPAQVVRARQLAEQFSIPLVDGSDLAHAKTRDVERFVRSHIESTQRAPNFFFLFADERLSLAQVTNQKLLSIRADFCSPTVNYRRHKGGGKGQMIAKAVGLNAGKIPTVLDATAGLGGDAFVLASLGCQITMIERVHEVRALLTDGLRIAAEWGSVHDKALQQILTRMQVIESDAASYLSALDGRSNPDVVYLDPMFPARNKSAQVKKEMYVFHELVGTDPDADHLLEIARATAKRRVVVKRPRIAPLLADAKPSYTLEGKSNRFDIYVSS